MGDDEKGAMAMTEDDGNSRETVVRAAVSNDEDRRGQVRASEGKQTQTWDGTRRSER